MISKILAICALLAISEAVKIKVDVSRREKQFTNIIYGVIVINCTLWGKYLCWKLRSFSFPPFTGVRLHRQVEEEGQERAGLLENCGHSRSWLSHLSRLSTHQLRLRQDASPPRNIRKWGDSMPSEWFRAVLLFSARCLASDSRKSSARVQKQFSVCIKQPSQVIESLHV